MKEYFEDAYDDFMSLPETFAEIGKDVLEIIEYILIYITLPIWVVPYFFYKKIKKRVKQNDR